MEIHLPSTNELESISCAQNFLTLLDISNKDISFEIAESLDVNIQKLNRALEDGEAATLLRAEVDTSIEFGVFGSPTFRVDNELFFGVEKMEVLNEWLTLGGW